MNDNNNQQSSKPPKRQRTLRPLPHDFDMNDVQSSCSYKEWSSLSDGEVLTKYSTNFIKGNERDEQRLIRRIHTLKYRPSSVKKRKPVEMQEYKSQKNDDHKEVVPLQSQSNLRYTQLTEKNNSKVNKKCNYNINHVITMEELKNRNHKSKPIYFTKNFIPYTRITQKLSTHHINNKMVHTFLVRDQQDIDSSTPVKVTDSIKMTVMVSMNVLKSFFRTRGYEIARKLIIDYYNKHYLQEGSQNITKIQTIFDRENDISKVCAFY